MSPKLRCNDNEMKGENAPKWDPASGEPSPLEPSYYRAIGEMTVLLSRLHYFCEGYFLLLLDTRREIGLALTETMQFSQLLHRVELVFEKRTANREHLKQLKQVTGKIEKAIKWRNDLAHSLWFIGDSEPVTYLVRQAKGEREKLMTLKQLNDFNRSIERSLGELMKFMISPASTKIFRNNRHMLSSD